MDVSIDTPKPFAVVLRVQCTRARKCARWNQRYKPFGFKCKSKLSLVHSIVASGRPAQWGVTLGIRLGPN